LVAALDGLAEVLIRAGELESAVAPCESLMEITANLVERDPSNTAWSYLLSGAHLRRAKLNLVREQPEAARADFDATVRLSEDLCAREPENLWRQFDLALACDWQGKCYRKLGLSADAHRSYERAYQLRQVLLQAQPDIPERQLDLVLSQTKLATWHLDQKTAEHDALAGELLHQAEASLLALEADGRLAGQEGEYGSWLPAIRKNQRLIEARAKRRAAASSESEAPAGIPGASRDGDSQSFFHFGPAEPAPPPPTDGLQ
jgi:hypothetical protein